MINCPLYLIPPSTQFNLSRFWFRFVDGCPEIGIIRLSGSDLSSSSPVFGRSFPFCSFSFLHSSVSLHTTHNSDLDFVFVAGTPDIGIIRLSGWPLFSLVTPVLLWLDIFLLVNNIIGTYQTSFSALVCHSQLLQTPSWKGYNLNRCCAVYLTFPAQLPHIAFTSSSFEACFSWA